MGNAALAERVREGDRAAFAELYGEYSDPIVEFCAVLLRDRDEAADAMHDAFMLAAQRIGQLRDLNRLNAWLFAIARHVCYRRLEQRRRVAPVGDPPDVLVLDDDPTAALSAADASALVWQAAAGLGERDRAVLYLSTNEGLEGAELAAALGVQHANPYSLLNRAKAQLERAIGVLLVARHGRSDCPGLREMLDGWSGELTPLLRKRLGRHIDACVSCKHTRTRAHPLAGLAALPLLSPRRADAMVERAMSADELREIASRRPRSHERWQRDGFPPPEDARRRRKKWALLAVAVLAISVGTLAEVASADGDTRTRPHASTSTIPARAQSKAKPASAPVNRARTSTSTTTATVAARPAVTRVTQAGGARPTAAIAPPVQSVPTPTTSKPKSQVSPRTTKRPTATTVPPPPTTVVTPTTGLGGQ